MYKIVKIRYRLTDHHESWHIQVFLMEVFMFSTNFHGNGKKTIPFYYTEIDKKELKSIMGDLTAYCHHLQMYSTYVYIVGLMNKCT